MTVKNDEMRFPLIFTCTVHTTRHTTPRRTLSITSNHILTSVSTNSHSIATPAASLRRTRSAENLQHVPYIFLRTSSPLGIASAAPRRCTHNPAAATASFNASSNLIPLATPAAKYPVSVSPAPVVSTTLSTLLAATLLTWPSASTYLTPFSPSVTTTRPCFAHLFLNSLSRSSISPSPSIPFPLNSQNSVSFITATSTRRHASSPRENALPAAGTGLGFSTTVAPTCFASAATALVTSPSISSCSTTTAPRIASLNRSSPRYTPLAPATTTMLLPPFSSTITYAVPVFSLSCLCTSFVSTPSDSSLAKSGSPSFPMAPASWHPDMPLSAVATATFAPLPPRVGPLRVASTVSPGAGYVRVDRVMSPLIDETTSTRVVQRFSIATCKAKKRHTSFSLRGCARP
ncbi:unnamed protein product [Chondrus crispus]|uniref:Uncharacterized protein n=1 Tax=Chondrus crispus TaxID=2769 RepID=R7QML5_CHOCR|nr:unnamed protein product [Chondrus crispus]CDF39344.1 unnamed protein product [Chondrus crispus]|eukprot:XP_005719255.1 unnamed protein product [Chondrus crispus]